MSDKRARVDLDVSKIADRQHGVLSTVQLNAAGLDKHGVLHRVRTGRLHRVHWGVYAVGHSALPWEAQWMAAVLACGRVESVTGAVLDFWGAALSHRSAACLWGMLTPRDGPIDVSVPGYGGKRRRRGIRLHRSLSLVPASVTLRDGIPVTIPARTIADLRRVSSARARLISSKDLRRAIRQADVLGLPIGEETTLDRSRSDLEHDFLRLCRRHRLPAPEVNVRVGRHRVDFLWRDRRLVVETDGYIYHRGRAAFEDDRARDLALRGLGYEVLRIADRQIEDEPEQIGAVLKARLARSPSGGPETRHAAP